MKKLTIVQEVRNVINSVNNIYGIYYAAYFSQFNNLYIEIASGKDNQIAKEVRAALLQYVQKLPHTYKKSVFIDILPDGNEIECISDEYIVKCEDGDAYFSFTPSDTYYLTHLFR